MEDFGDYDEDILGDENIDKFNNDEEEAALDKLIEQNKTQTKKRTIKPRPKLTERDLIGLKGYCSLRTMFENWKPKQKNPLDNVESMMRKFEYWGHNLAPHMNFHDFVERAMKLSKSRPVKTYMTKLRAGLPLFEEDKKEKSPSPEEYDIEEETGSKILSKKISDDFDDDVDDSAFGGPEDEYDFESAWQEAMGSGDAQEGKNDVEKPQNEADSPVPEGLGVFSAGNSNRTLAELSDEETPKLNVDLESDLEDEIPTQKILSKVSDSESSDDEGLNREISKFPTQNPIKRRRVVISDDDEDEDKENTSVKSPDAAVEPSSPTGVKRRRRLVIESDDEDDYPPPKSPRTTVTGILDENDAMDVLLGD